MDLDGTLIDSTGVWHQIDLDFLSRRGIPWTPEYDQGVIHTIFPLAAQFTKEYGSLPESPEEIMAEWMDMALEAYSHRIPLKPYVRPFLEQCARHGISMAIYTSCEPVLCQAVLERHGIRSYFSQIIYASQLGVEKRSPAAFTAALAQLGGSTAGCRFFDDSPVSCAGAKGAGLSVTGVYNDLFAGQEAEMRALCDSYIYDFSELLENPAASESK